jgi:hypothetical protein
MFIYIEEMHDGRHIKTYVDFLALACLHVLAFMQFLLHSS